MLNVASCLVILTEAGKGKFAVRISTPAPPQPQPPRRVTKPAQKPRSTGPGASAKSSSGMLPQDRA